MKKPSTAQLKKYFTGQLTKAETAEVLDWLGTRQGQAYYEKILDEEIAQTDIGDSSTERSLRQDLLQNIHEQIDTKTGSPHRRKIRYGMIAATISILMVFTYFTNILYTEGQNKYTTGYGEIKNIELEDGTSITLNANSSLSFRDKRVVQLNGEAFFSVRHLDNHQPFIVITDELEVDVLGTEFNVSSRRRETEVILNKGSVQLQLFKSTDTTRVSMSPGDLVAFAENEENFRKEIVDTDKLTAWRNNALIFDHTPFSEIQLLLEDNYGLDVQVRNQEIMNLEFTAELPADDVDLLLKLMEKSFNISITKTKNRVLMKKKQD